MSPRGNRARRTSASKRTIWLAAGAVVLAGTGVTAVAVSGGPGGTGAEDGSRAAQAHTPALDGKAPSMPSRLAPRPNPVEELTDRDSPQAVAAGLTRSRAESRPGRLSTTGGPARASRPAALA